MVDCTLHTCTGALPAMVESLGDYFAAADISGAPVPPPSVISRAVALQGATCALAGVWGTTSGTTAYNEVILHPFWCVRVACCVPQWWVRKQACKLERPCKQECKHCNAVMLGLK
jgi:hypothetical protein